MPCGGVPFRQLQQMTCDVVLVQPVYTDQLVKCRQRCWQLGARDALVAADGDERPVAPCVGAIAEAEPGFEAVSVGIHLPAGGTMSEGRLAENLLEAGASAPHLGFRP